MLTDLTSSELEEHWMYEKLEADLGKSVQQRREEERMAREAAGRVSRKKRGKR
jgi:hypothetical protein